MNATLSPAAAPTLDGVRPALVEFGHAHPQIERITVFGSVARGESTPTSDVDVVVDFLPDRVPSGLAGFGFLDDLENELAAHLGRPVHLVEADAVTSATAMGCHAFPRAVARDGHLVYASSGPTAI